MSTKSKPDNPEQRPDETRELFERTAKRTDDPAIEKLCEIGCQVLDSMEEANS